MALRIRMEHEWEWRQIDKGASQASARIEAVQEEGARPVFSEIFTSIKRL